MKTLALCLLLALPVGAQPVSPRDSGATPLRLEPDGKLRLLEQPQPTLIQLDVVEGNVGDPLPVFRPSPWWMGPDVGWGLSRYGQSWRDPWAPYYGRQSVSNPYGPCW